MDNKIEFIWGYTVYWFELSFSRIDMKRKIFFLKKRAKDFAKEKKKEWEGCVLNGKYPKPIIIKRPMPRSSCIKDIDVEFLTEKELRAVGSDPLSQQSIIIKC